jgi:hypothetical protein
VRGTCGSLPASSGKNAVVPPCFAEGTDSALGGLPLSRKPLIRVDRLASESRIFPRQISQRFVAVRHEAMGGDGMAGFCGGLATRAA